MSSVSSENSTPAESPRGEPAPTPAPPVPEKDPYVKVITKRMKAIPTERQLEALAKARVVNKQKIEQRKNMTTEMEALKKQNQLLQEQLKSLNAPPAKAKQVDEIPQANKKRQVEAAPREKKGKVPKTTDPSPVQQPNRQVPDARRMAASIIFGA